MISRRALTTITYVIWATILVGMKSYITALMLSVAVLLLMFFGLDLAIYVLLTFSIALSKDVILTATAFATVYTAHRLELKPTIGGLGFVIAILCLILFKLKLGILALPLAIAFYTLKCDSRIFTGTAIVLLTASAYALSALGEKPANEIAIHAYYFLILGVAGALIEYLRENKADDSSVKEAG